MEADCEGQLNTPVAGAAAAYRQAKADVAALGAKYLARADGLRRSRDRKVEGLLAEMASELRAAGLPANLVDETRQAYEDRIVKRQAEIFRSTPPG
jgi:hypothetical protein